MYCDQDSTAKEPFLKVWNRIVRNASQYECPRQSLSIITADSLSTDKVRTAVLFRHSMLNCLSKAVTVDAMPALSTLIFSK
jgi:hypothetical protein